MRSESLFVLGLTTDGRDAFRNKRRMEDVNKCRQNRSSFSFGPEFRGLPPHDPTVCPLSQTSGQFTSAVITVSPVVMGPFWGSVWFVLCLVFSPLPGGGGGVV